MFAAFDTRREERKEEKRRDLSWVSLLFTLYASQLSLSLPMTVTVDAVNNSPAMGKNKRQSECKNRRHNTPGERRRERERKTLSIAFKLMVMRVMMARSEGRRENVTS